MSSQIDEMMKMMKKMMSDNEALRSEVETLKKCADSSTDSSTSMYSVDTEALLVLIMKFTNGNDAWEMVKLAYRGDPESFKIVGTLHTDTDGKAYYTMRQTISPILWKSYHLYGTQKFNKFTVKNIKLFLHKTREIDFGDFGTPDFSRFRSAEYVEGGGGRGYYNPCDFFKPSA